VPFSCHNGNRAHLRDKNFIFTLSLDNCHLLKEIFIMGEKAAHVTFADVMGCYDGKDYIDCSNRGLTSLSGCPEKVKDFNCSGNLLQSLDGAPEEVHGDFDCSDNRLNTLDGSPVFVMVIN
jgi:hypothetical protein